MISNKTIQEAVELLIKAANPTRIILFGSYARGDTNEQSDLDFLIVKKELKARRMETVRLRDVLSPLRIPVDVVVISEKTYQDWKDAPGTVIYEATQEGRVVYGASLKGKVAPIQST
jgi:predicted nucleotidyltransferase